MYVVICYCEIQSFSFTYVYKSVSVHICAEAREGIGSLGVGVTGVCELGTESWDSEKVSRFVKHKVIYLSP